MAPIILASASTSRAALLHNACVPCTLQPARVDEDALKAGLLAEGTSHRDIADALAEAKAKKVSMKTPGALVIGADQVLSFGDHLLSKTTSPAECLTQLQMLRGQEHRLYSAAVIYLDGRPIWRHIGEARLTMHDLPDDWLRAYVDRNWDEVQYSVGGYLIEKEGVRLFSEVRGDVFTILGLPLVPLLSYLTQSGRLDT